MMPRKRGWGIVRLACVGLCLAVLGVFCLQAGRGIGRVRRGEATPAQVIADTVDWLRGIERESS